MKRIKYLNFQIRRFKIMTDLKTGLKILYYYQSFNYLNVIKIKIS